MKVVFAFLESMPDTTNGIWGEELQWDDKDFVAEQNKMKELWNNNWLTLPADQDLLSAGHLVYRRRTNEPSVQSVLEPSLPDF